jgi:hypothetical protein
VRACCCSFSCTCMHDMSPFFWLVTCSGTMGCCLKTALLPHGESPCARVVHHDSGSLTQPLAAVLQDACCSQPCSLHSQHVHVCVTQCLCVVSIFCKSNHTYTANVRSCLAGDCKTMGA